MNWKNVSLASNYGVILGIYVQKNGVVMVVNMSTEGVLSFYGIPVMELPVVLEKNGGYSE